MDGPNTIVEFSYNPSQEEANLEKGSPKTRPIASRRYSGR